MSLKVGFLNFHSSVEFLGNFLNSFGVILAEMPLETLFRSVKEHGDDDDSHVWKILPQEFNLRGPCVRAKVFIVLEKLENQLNNIILEYQENIISLLICSG